MSNSHARLSCMLVYCSIICTVVAADSKWHHQQPKMGVLKHTRKIWPRDRPSRWSEVLKFGWLLVSTASHCAFTCAHTPCIASRMFALCAAAVLNACMYSYPGIQMCLALCCCLPSLLGSLSACMESVPCNRHMPAPAQLYYFIWLLSCLSSIRQCSCHSSEQASACKCIYHLMIHRLVAV